MRLVGIELIWRDLSVSYQDPCHIAARSIPHGVSLHPSDDDDDELDYILHHIMLGLWDDRRARQKIQESEEKKRARDEASLQDSNVVDGDEVALRDAAAVGLMRLSTDGKKVRLSFVNTYDWLQSLLQPKKSVVKNKVRGIPCRKQSVSE